MSLIYRAAKVDREYLIKKLKKGVWGAYAR